MLTKIIGVDNTHDVIFERQRHGFTLVELLVTIALVAFFALIAVPSFTGIIQNSMALSATNQLKSALRLGYSEAITRHQSISIRADDVASKDNEWGAGWCIYQNAYASCEAVPEGDLIRNTRFKDDKMVINSQGSSNRSLLIFSKDGRLDQGSTFAVSNGESRRKFCVRILRFGRSRSWEIDNNNPSNANGIDQCQ